MVLQFMHNTTQNEEVGLLFRSKFVIKVSKKEAHRERARERERVSIYLLVRTCGFRFKHLFQSNYGSSNHYFLKSQGSSLFEHIVLRYFHFNYYCITTIFQIRLKKTRMLAPYFDQHVGREYDSQVAQFPLTFRSLRTGMWLCAPVQ